MKPRIEIKRQLPSYPVIDLHATGANIRQLRIERGYSIHEVQRYMGFETVQAIYHWQSGTSLPSLDSAYAFSRLLGVTVNDILVPVAR